jgi:radical SAM superfamily enzyme YgiQ (UPF0313 family)
VEAICDLVAARGLDLNLWAYARVDTVDERLLPKLRRAGFKWLALGIESGNGRVRSDVQKPFGQDEIHRTIGAIREASLHVIGNYIFGLPDDDHETMQETLDLAIELNCEFANFYTAMAYPGSDLYRQAIENGWELPGTWSGYSQHAKDTRPLPTRHLPAADVLRFRDEAFQQYFSGERYLRMIERTFGSEAVEHIRHMTAHRLQRDLYSGHAGPAIVAADGFSGVTQASSHY